MRNYSYEEVAGMHSELMQAAYFAFAKEHSWPPDLFAGGWREIEADLEKALRPWYNLPDPKVVKEVESLFKQLVGSLATGGSAEGTSIGTSLGIIKNRLPDMRGATIETFKTGVLESLPEVVENLHAAALLASATVETEAALFKEAREEFAILFTQAFDAFEKRGSGGETSGLQIVLQILAVGFSAATAAVSGGATVALTVVAGTTGAAAVLAEADAKKREFFESCDSVSEITANLVKAIETISTDLREGEESIRKGLERALSRITYPQDENAFELVFQPIESVGDDTKMVGYEVDTICKELDKICETVSKAKVVLENCGFGTSLKRPSEVGMGPSGPTSALDDYLLQLGQLLGDLEQDIRLGKENFNAAYQALVSQDAAVSQSLHATAEKVRVSDISQSISRAMGAV
jgi:hypothetical protein